MSFSVRLYQGFKKKKNSTKLPSGNYDDIPCVLKAPTDIFNPTIEISYGEPFDAQDNTRLADYSYCYIPIFNRYYFIDAIRYVGRVWEIVCTCDTLASFRGDILESNKYVLRSASEHNTYVKDAMYPTIARTSGMIQGSNVPWQTSSLAQGKYIMGIITAGKSASNVGCITYYCFTMAQCQSVLSAVFDINNTGGANQSDLPDDVFKALLNPSQYISSLMYIPFDYNPTGRATLQFGWYTAGATTYPCVLYPTYHFSDMEFSWNAHPQGEGYLNITPYTAVELYVPCFGNIPIDTMKAIDRTILVRPSMDVITGQAVLKIYAKYSDGSMRLLDTVNGQIGVPLPVGQVIQNGGGMLSALHQKQQALFANQWNNQLTDNLLHIGGKVLSLNLGGLFTEYADRRETAAQTHLSYTQAGESQAAAAMPSAYSSGASGSMVETCDSNSNLNAIAILTATYTRIASRNQAQDGLPLNETRTLSNLSGFTIVSNGSVDCAGSGYEKEVIAMYLTSGFFIE